MSQPSSPAARIFRFLGRVQFTMILLIVGVLAMIIGTVIESRSGFEAAQTGVYRTAWFQAYLFLIGVNLVVAVVNRIPIQRHQWAFVVTHAAIVLMLTGAWISANFGFEGKLVVREGSSENAIWLEGAELRAEWGGRGERAFLLGRNTGLAGRVLRGGSTGFPGLRIAEFVPNGEFRAQLVDAADAGAAGSPGIEVHLEGMGIHTHEWLIGEHPHFRRKDVGPVEVELLVVRSEEFLRERFPARDSATAHVKIKVVEGRAPVRLQLPASIGREVDLGDGLHAKVVSYVKRATVKAGGVTERPDGPLNPAAIVEVWRGTARETHTVFSEFPGYNLAKGGDTKKPLVLEVGLVTVAVEKKPLVTVLVDPKTERLWVQLSASVGRGEAHPFRVGGTVGVGNLGLDLRVLKYVPSAQPKVGVQPAAKKDDGEPWMRIVASNAGNEASEWLRYGSGQTMQLGDRRLSVSWRQRREELPFTVALDEFDVDFHGGSRRPAQFRSAVRILDASGAERSARISMNSPLDHAGFRLFQSSYRQTPGQPDQSILTVSRDPGIALVYPSFFLLIFGVGWYLLGSRRQHVPALPDTLGDAEPTPDKTDGPADDSHRRSRPSATVS